MLEGETYQGFFTFLAILAYCAAYLFLKVTQINYVLRDQLHNTAYGCQTFEFANNNQFMTHISAVYEEKEVSRACFASNINFPKHISIVQKKKKRFTCDFCDVKHQSYMKV